MLSIGGLKSISMGGVPVVSPSGTFSGSVTALQFISTQASGSNGLTLNTAGARLKFSSGGTTDYFSGDGATEIRAAGSLRAVSRVGLIGTTSNPDLMRGTDFGLTTDAMGIRGGAANGATAKAVIITNFPSLTTSGAKIAAFYPDNGATEKVAIDIAGKFVYPTGTADAIAGIATLAGGTITVNTTSVTASSVILYARKTTGGTEGHLRISASVAGTSFTITSSSGTETSTVSWLIIN